MTIIPCVSALPRLTGAALRGTMIRTEMDFRWEDQNRHLIDKTWIGTVSDMIENLSIEGMLGPWEGLESGASDWTGNHTPQQALTCMRDGNLAGVAKSDQFLAQFEHMVPISTGRRTRDNVVGAMPNVPNYLAGNPYNMRLKTRVSSQSAPLTIFADITSSSTFWSNVLEPRGAAILALVRLLALSRPVELYAIVASGNRGRTSYRWNTCVKIDTAPLDLARAAYILTHPGCCRHLFYRMEFMHVHDDPHHHGFGGGPWPFNDTALSRATHADALKAAISPTSDVLYVPGVYAKDQMVKDPAAWLKAMLAQHGGLAMEGAA